MKLHFDAAFGHFDAFSFEEFSLSERMVRDIRVCHLRRRRDARNAFPEGQPAIARPGFLRRPEGAGL